MKTWMAVVWMTVVCASTMVSSAATLRVPQDYERVELAVYAAKSGDVIEIASGNYVTWYGWAQIAQNNLTLRGVGPTRPVIDCRHAALSSKGCYIVSGRNVTLENLEIMNTRVNPDAGANGSGIRLEGGSVTVRNCYIHDCDNGIMGGSSSSADILVEYSEFERNGRVDWITRQPDQYSGYSHNLYIGTVRSFTLRHCWSHATAAGHEVKTRALTNHILYNYLWSETTGSRELQIAQGGTAYIIGNVIRQGPGSQNAEIIAYGGEGNNANPYLYVVNNTLINERPQNTVFLRVNNNPTQAVFRNNVIQQLGNETIVGGTYAGKVPQETNWITTNAFFRNPADHNFRLTAASIGALDAGSAPGIGYNSVSLTPVYQHVFPYSTQQRPTDGAIDIGAYEYTPNAAPVVDAGADQVVLEGQEIILLAVASDFDADALTYAWNQSTGLNVVPTGTATADLHLVAPTVSTLAEATMAFTVTVSDGYGGITSDTVNVRVCIPGDANRDDAVDVEDLLTLVATFGSVSEDPAYDATCDFNSDDMVDVVDLITLVDNWGRALE